MANSSSACWHFLDFFFSVYILTVGCLNLWMWDLWIWRADCTGKGLPGSPGGREGLPDRGQEG